ncbi:MAG: YHS domain-containing protein [Candidatus Sigynarchaeota archaeon]
MTEIDPVCYKTIDTEKEFRRTRYKIRDFYFCSDMCKKEFDQNADFYSDFALD